MDSRGPGRGILSCGLVTPLDNDPGDNIFFARAKTKVMATPGRNRSKQTMIDWLNAGMDIMRLNMSHGDHKYHAESIALLREACSDLRRTCAILLDTKGPEIRTCDLVDHEEVLLKMGQEFLLVADPAHIGDASSVGVTYATLPQVVSPGNIILVDDGILELTVLTSTDTTVLCRVMNDALLGERKGLNLPGISLDCPDVSESDKADIQFGIDQTVDFIGASFIRDAAGVLAMKNMVRPFGIQVLAKLETLEGLYNFESIVEAADGITVARGDLGIEIPLEKVFAAQKMILNKCNLLGKPVITATQLLHSMHHSQTPTQAEVSDVGNSVFDGTDCLSLSSETAKGKYPVQTMKMAKRICQLAESSLDYTALVRQPFEDVPGSNLKTRVLAQSAVKLCTSVGATLIICFTNTGNTARAVARFRPAANTLCVTANSQTANQLMVCRGLIPLLLASVVGAQSLLPRIVDYAKYINLCRTDDKVVIVAGSQLLHSPHSFRLMEVT